MGTSFSGAILHGADLSNGHFTNASFVEADMRYAVLTAPRLVSALSYSEI